MRRTIFAQFCAAAVLCFSGLVLATPIIPLSNLFDDPKLTSLATAIGTDTFTAIADVTDLGV